MTSRKRSSTLIKKVRYCAPFFLFTESTRSKHFVCIFFVEVVFLLFFPHPRATGSKSFGWLIPSLIGITNKRHHVLGTHASVILPISGMSVCRNLHGLPSSSQYFNSYRYSSIEFLFRPRTMSKVRERLSVFCSLLLRLFRFILSAFCKDFWLFIPLLHQFRD